MLDAERSNIDVDGQEEGDEDVAGDNTNVVVVNKSPDRKVDTLGDGSSSEDCNDEESRVKG